MHALSMSASSGRKVQLSIYSIRRGNSRERGRVPFTPLFHLPFNTCHTSQAEQQISFISSSLRASSPILASEASLARTRRSLARSCETRFTRPNRRACLQGIFLQARWITRHYHYFTERWVFQWLTTPTATCTSDIYFKQSAKFQYSQLIFGGHLPILLSQ